MVEQAGVGGCRPSPRYSAAHPLLPVRFGDPQGVRDPQDPPVPQVPTRREAGRRGFGECDLRDEIAAPAFAVGEGTVRNFVWDRVDQVMAKRSSKRMANCALAAVHSRAGILHSLSARFNTRYSSFSTASSVGKWPRARTRSEEHTSELQSRQYLVCRLLLEKNNT